MCCKKILKNLRLEQNIFSFTYFHLNSRRGAGNNKVGRIFSKSSQIRDGGNNLKSEVEGKGRFKTTYPSQFVSVLHEVMVHSTLLPKCPNDSTTSLECCKCKKYLTGYVIMTSQVIENGSNIRNYTFHTKIWYIVPFYRGGQ